MLNNLCTALLIFTVQNVLVSCTDYFVIITSNDPAIQGAEITISAKLLASNGVVPSGTFEYIWVDNGIKAHTRYIKTEKTEDTWNVTYPASDYPPGSYTMQVTVNKCYIWGSICSAITSKRLDINVTSVLNGHMKLTQQNNTVTSQYVASKIPMVHEISLTQPDADFLKHNATSIVTYWFVDCVYYGSSTNFSFSFKYNDTNSEHVVEALVVAGFEPITTPAPPTTTSKPTTTTKSTTTKPTTKPAPLTTKSTTTTVKPTTTTGKPTTTTVKSNTSLKPIVTSSAPLNISEKSSGNAIKKENWGEQSISLFHHQPTSRRKRATNIEKIDKNATIHDTTNISFPYVCMNKTEDPPEREKVYGYFSRHLIVKEPITNITLTGNNWLKQGEEVKLQVKCNGSPPFHYCINYYYNATRKDTCNPDIPLDSCSFDIEHYYGEPNEHNILVVVRNLVTTYKSPVTVNIYKVEKHSQLSVIVVPVSFSLVAIVLIIFGLAYYIQNRRRFTVEVANFDFGQQYSDLEYKTFRERLRDSISNAFTKTPKSETPEPSMWPGNRKYGSMT